MLPIKKDQQAIVKRIIQQASFEEITPDKIVILNQSLTHIQFLFEQLTMFGYLSKLTNGCYVRA
ncbi:hypothetical protein [Aliivibrio wodanis]|uniref:hypothetical protein n=1 Tax=Aliivibrio wodanis TaxID=80852 RepID=UPI00406C6055